MRQRPVRSGGSGWLDRMMWVVRSDEGGDGRTKMGTNPDSSGLREKRGFSLEGKDNQQKTYDNETGECTSGQGPIFIQDWQVHLGPWGTKSADPINRLGMSGCVHRLVKGEQSDKDNKRVMKENSRIKET